MINYVDSQEVLSAINGHMWHSQEDKYLATEIVKNTPTEDPVKHGHWISNEAPFHTWKCSECRISVNRTRYDYCPNCGCRMDEVTE